VEANVDTVGSIITQKSQL